MPPDIAIAFRLVWWGWSLLRFCRCLVYSSSSRTGSSSSDWTWMFAEDLCHWDVAWWLTAHWTNSFGFEIQRLHGLEGITAFVQGLLGGSVLVSRLFEAMRGAHGNCERDFWALHLCSSSMSVDLLTDFQDIDIIVETMLVPEYDYCERLHLIFEILSRHWYPLIVQHHHQRTLVPPGIVLHPCQNWEETYPDLENEFLSGVAT